MRPLLLVVLAVSLAACGSAEREAAPAGHGGGVWERLPDPPLGPREGAVAVPVGGQTLIVGGSDADPCPPNADCAPPSEPPLRDGALYDPRTGAWKRIADAPAGLGFASPAVVGGDVFLLAPGEPWDGGASPAFLRYRPAEDAWSRLPVPRAASLRSLAAAGDQVVAYATTDESEPVPDLVFDAAHGEWRELPGDPLPPAFDRAMAWSGSELVLFAHELVRDPNGREPSVVIAAAYDAGAATWRRLPDSEILGGGARWFALDGRLVLAALGSADGGETNNWGRHYPNGGELATESGRWLGLPDPPAGADEFSAGVVAGGRADFWGQQGWILDAVSGAWTRVPPLDVGDDDVSGRSVAAAGRDLLAFGGARWPTGSMEGELLGTAWLWRVP
ncbi:MAG: hypothetical protein ABW060_05680 [Solirubrobacteraceae bacterium]